MYSVVLQDLKLCLFRFLFFTAIRRPVVATNIMSTAGATTANISFIIPIIAYTPENYTIRYTGETFQTTQATSILRMSSDNISMVNERYMFTLRGLEEADTYSFTVDSTNCNGTTSTAVMNFTTISTRKGGMGRIHTQFISCIAQFNTESGLV